MTDIYRVVFRKRAAKAFDKLDFAIQRQLSLKLEERRRQPELLAHRLRKLPNCYRIKLRASGVRLVYQVRKDVLVILVLSVGARDQEEAYLSAEAALARGDD